MSIILTSLTRVRNFRSRSDEKLPQPSELGTPTDEGKVDILSPPPPLQKDSGGTHGQPKQEQIIRDNLARFARLPAYSVFESVSFFFFFFLSYSPHNSLQPHSDPSGLTHEIAASSLLKHGRNILATERPQSPLSLLAVAIANPFNFLLIVLAIISIATGDRATFSVMMSMVVASTGLRSVIFIHLFFFFFFFARLNSPTLDFGRISNQWLRLPSSSIVLQPKSMFFAGGPIISPRK